MMDKKTGVATGGFSTLGAILPLLGALPAPVADLLPANDAAASVIGATVLGALPPAAKWLWDFLGRIHERRIKALEDRANQAEAEAETIRVREIKALQNQLLMLGASVQDGFREVRDRQDSATQEWSRLLQESRHDTNDAMTKALSQHDRRVMETLVASVQALERLDAMARQQEKSDERLAEWIRSHDARQGKVIGDIEALKADVRSLSEFAGNQRKLMIDRRDGLRAQE